MAGKSLDERMSLPEIAAQHATAMKPYLPKKNHFEEWYLERLKKVGYLFDRMMAVMAYKVHEKLRTEDDWVTLFIGREGTGKTTLAAQWCSYIDTSMKINQVTWDSTQFYTALQHSKVGQSVLIDEGGINLLSRESMSLGNRDMIKTFMVMRKKCLNTAICIPDYKDVDSYIRNHRVHLLVMLQSRGKYKATFGKGIEKINAEMRKMKHKINNITLPNGYFWQGYWNERFPQNLSKAEYDAAKDAHINKFVNERIRESTLLDKQIPAQFMTTLEAAKMLGVRQEQVYSWAKQGNIKALKINNRWLINKTDIFQRCGLLKPAQEDNI